MFNNISSIPKLVLFQRYQFDYKLHIYHFLHMLRTHGIKLKQNEANKIRTIS